MLLVQRSGDDLFFHFSMLRFAVSARKDTKVLKVIPLVEERLFRPFILLRAGDSVWPEKDEGDSPVQSLPQKPDRNSRGQTCQTEPSVRKGSML